MFAHTLENCVVACDCEIVNVCSRSYQPIDRGNWISSLLVSREELAPVVYDGDVDRNDPISPCSFQLREFSLENEVPSSTERLRISGKEGMIERHHFDSLSDFAKGDDAYAKPLIGNGLEKMADTIRQSLATNR